MPTHKLVGLGAGACLTLAALAISPTTTAHAAAAPAATPAASHGPAAGWATTATQALDVAKGLRLLGPAPAGRVLTISVSLPVRHRAAMDTLMQRLSNPASASYGHYLKPAQVRARFGPSTADVASVRGYLRREGFTHVSVPANRLLVTGQASVAQVERAFHTHLASYAGHGQHAIANTTPALVPAALEGKVLAVLGLQSFHMTLPITVRAAHPASTNRTAARPAGTAAGTPDLGGFTPKQIAKVYDATSLPAAKKTTIAVVAGGDLTAIRKNLRYAEKVQHYPRVPMHDVYTAPKPAITRDNPLSGNAEWDLDVQMSTMEAQSVKRLDVYDIATFTDPDVARAINLFVSDDRDVAMSASLGECDELAWLDGSLITTDEALEEGALQGQSMFASTGDNGSFCPEGASTGVPGGGPGQSWPAVGEYTTAVGGTTLVADSAGNVTSEISWIGGGGGVSAVADGGPWTYQTNPLSQTASLNNFGGRAVPDISSDADPNTGVLIYTGSKTPEAIGGTSVSSPTVMGLWARIEGANHNKLGLASNRLYRLYNKSNPATVVQTALGPEYVPAVNPVAVPGLRDVILGSNGLYTAKPGWDYTTGVGTPLAAQLAHQLSKSLSRNPSRHP